MTQPQDKMRAEFEAWAKRHEKGINLTHEGAGYRYSLAEMYWEAWQAACAQQSAQSQQGALDAARWREIGKHANTNAYSNWRQEIVIRFDTLKGKSLESIVDAAIATQGASNV